MRIYDGKGMILGRLSTRVAKDAMMGEEVRIVNCEQVVISGSKQETCAREKHKRERQGYPPKAPKFSRLADRFIRRKIRGMLPWKETRGKEAFKRIMCYRGVPAELAGQEFIVLEKASAKKLPTLKYITVGEVCNYLNGKAK